MASCVAAGGGHYVTFNGHRFPSSCGYLLNGLSSPEPCELADFCIPLGTGPDSNPSSLQALGSSTLVFHCGWDTVVSCLHVTYAPGIHMALALPAAYRGHVMGLYADYNGDPMDDPRVSRVVASTKLPEDVLAWAFGRGYLLGSPAGCLDAAGKMLPLPPSCVTLPTTSTTAYFAHICDILLDALGPF
ncbi:hypothetical protein HPG69_012546 [Diceros bicornis minor]|uniref:Uncharacterized protein n=1 Tax=Diceros bicornis minor TaxID=77932 RepID=A0A7J7F8A0_DICBM|nr:hypothetical protein HPG69_012546 [Diceros bicornis minor]